MGGAGAAMNAVIKSNRNMLKKRDSFKTAYGDFNIVEGKYKYAETSAKELRDLRKRLKEEKRVRQIKIYTILSFIMICIITTLIYLA